MQAGIADSDLQHKEYDSSRLCATEASMLLLLLSLLAVQLSGKSAKVLTTLPATDPVQD